MEHGIEVKRMRRNKQEAMEMYRQMCCLRRQGDSRAQIAGAFGCSVSTVDRAVRLCGEKEIKRDSFEEHREKVLQMYDGGATQKEIADATGMSVSAIHRRLRKMGKRRRRGWRPEGSTRKPMGHREQEETFPAARQYAQADVRRVKAIRVKVRGRWKTMQDVSDWWL